MARGLPADHLGRVSDRELRRACADQSCCCSGGQRDRRRLERIFYAQRQSDPDCLGITDEQRHAHSSADGHIYRHPVAHRIANPHRYANRDAGAHTGWHGPQHPGADPDVSLYFRAAC